jgi:hypothetical protein
VKEDLLGEEEEEASSRKQGVSVLHGGLAIYIKKVLS